MHMMRGDMGRRVIFCDHRLKGCPSGNDALVIGTNPCVLSFDQRDQHGACAVFDLLSHPSVIAILLAHALDLPIQYVSRALHNLKGGAISALQPSKGEGTL